MNRTRSVAAGRWATAAMLALPVMAGLSGCMGPRSHPPASANVTVPAAWRTDNGMAGVDIDPQWWAGLGDPVLAGLVEQALAYNTDIGQAAARVTEADAQVRNARSYQLPSLSLQATGIPRERIVSQTTLKGVNLSQYQVQAGASYDADIFGGLRKTTQAAQARYLAVRATQDGVRIAVVASVVANYCQLRALDATRAVLNTTHDNLAREVAMRRHQREVGAVSTGVVLQAQAALHQVELQQAQVAQNIAEQENALSLVLGQNPQAIPRGKALMALPLLPVPDTVPSRLLRRRPDIAAAEEHVIAADHDLDASRAAFMPDLSLKATVGRVAADVFPAPVNIWSFAGTILAPLFEGGRLRANEDAASARRDEAAFAYRGTVLAAFRDVENGLSALAQTSLQERAAVAQQEEFEGIYQRARHRFDLGDSTYFEVLSDERSQLDARLSVVQARADRLLATVRLYQAMGGGWTLPGDMARPANGPVSTDVAKAHATTP